SIDWNSTLGAINDFNTTFNDYRINFTVPATWENFMASDGSVDKTSDITLGLISNGYRELQISNAWNETNWYIAAQSTNLLQEVRTLIDSVNYNTVNYTNVIDFYANFTTTIQNGIVNLTVYSPDLVINHTKLNNTFSSDQVFLSSWDTAGEDIPYGVFKVQMFWNNDTEAGFREKNLIILGSTDLILVNPSSPLIDKSKTDPSFNIDVFFNDTGKDVGITADSVTYFNVSGSNYGNLTAGAPGEYGLTLNPSDYDYGYNYIYIFANKSYFNNQSITIRLNIMNTTEIIGPSTNFTIVNYESVIYSFDYNDTIIGELIPGANISSWEGHANFIHNWVDHINGSYTVNLTANEVPASTTPYEYNFTISKDGKESYEISLSITIDLIDTEIIFISNISNNYQRLTGFDYSSRLYINRTDTNAPIAGLDSTNVQITYNGGIDWPNPPGWTLTPDGNQYILNVSINDASIVSDIYTITVNISKSGVYNWDTIDLSFTLIGNFSHIEDFTLLEGSTELFPSGVDGYYNSTIESTLTVKFNISDDDRGGRYLSTAANILDITIYYNRTSETPINASFSATTDFGIGTSGLSGTINLDTLPSIGHYTIIIYIKIENYEIISQEFKIEVRATPEGGLTFEQLLSYIVIGAIVAVASGGSVAIYRGIVVPKKREKARILTEVKTIFDDAVNLEHVLVLYKGTGTCIYFKSFGSEQIDPELISGFISAISSFGKDLVSQEELNEISYGDKMLLLSDGEHIRVALVLSKKASLILRRNLMEFIHVFERSYSSELPDWRGQLNIFRDAGTIVDEILSTSIILPHEITYDYSTVKDLKKTQSREVLKIANNLMKDSERNFFFIATLLKQAADKTSKDTAEIFMGIKELRDTKILMPIEISAIEAKPISQQELNLINQKVSGLVRLSPEERQKLVNDLAQIGPIEREAYFVSLTEQHAIVSAPIQSKIGAAVIDSVKIAKKEIKNLKKNALNAKKEKDFDKSIKIFQNAVKIATTWELITESQELDDIMRMTKIEDLRNKMKILEKEAKLAAKKENFNEAAQKYKISSKIASEIFKLGITEMTKEVKRLSNKSKEYEKLV
ncbi:MAG: hypothetical protein JSV23_04785, partial [Promethearchaeota archaeon]